MIKRLDATMQIIINHRLLTAILLAGFLAGLVPVLSLAGINCATGDDYGYGVLTRAAWLSTHSLTEVLKAGCETVRNFYNGWQGTWFTLFLFTLQPEVFSPEAYVIVPWMMLFIWFAATGILLHYLLIRVCGFSTWIWLSVSTVFLGAGVQFIPSTKSAIFWYNGNAHYTIPYAMVLLAFFFCLIYLRRGSAAAYILWLAPGRGLSQSDGVLSQCIAG